MSEGIVRKVQPFTIGTRLSVPAVPKCQEFTPSYLPNETLDNCVLQHNLNSLYLCRSKGCAHGSCLVPPIVKQAVPVKHNQEHMAAEDHLNQNVGSPFSAVSRSIKKITISGSKDRAENLVVTGPARLPIAGSSSENNNNNNNISNTSEAHLPRIVGVSCENKPNSQFKVLLRKDSCDEMQPVQGQTWMKLNGETSVQQSSVAKLQTEDLQAIESDSHTESGESAAFSAQSDCFTQRNSLFSKEVLQAEAWIRGKLQDLKDGCNAQCCPLQDWEEASHTLQRDLKDFENTLIQLNQMGDQLICKLNPTSDLVKKQLGQLKDQWQTLKQAAIQTRTPGGAKCLQEFNKKVDQLEGWIKEKQEEEQSLVNVLRDNVDKMQLTRRILDLKQDEQLHRNLHEEINNLALKLEKQGKTDGKSISSRRKHINKMWLKVQPHLKNYHENLHEALEVSSFYQQADNILFAIDHMKKSMGASKELDGFGDREMRDIASQIMMLDVSVSQMSNLHPALGASIVQKQSEVKDGWTLLQKVYRSDRTTLSLAASAFTREDVDLLTAAGETHCNMGTETYGIMGKEVKEEQNRLKGCVSMVDWENGRPTRSPDQRSASRTSTPTGDVPVCPGGAVVKHEFKRESRKPGAEPKLATAPQGHPQLHAQLQKFTVSADKTLSWLKDNVSMATQVCSLANSEGLEAARRCQQILEKEILTNRARIEVVKREGYGLVRAQHPGSCRIEEFLGQLEVLWEELRRRHQRNASFLLASEELGFRTVKVLQALGSLEAWLESVELSIKESALDGDPETMSVAERESCLLEREVAARSRELSTLRQEVDRLHAHSHPHARDLPARMEEVEKKYYRIQSALTQQSSELQDTRMLTEFLERVELEENQELGGNRCSLTQAPHNEMSAALSLMGFHRSGCVGGNGESLIEAIGDPVEELREAVEMLNDTVRERGRSQNHDQAIQALLSKHARLAVRVEECLSCSKELKLDILEKETDMAIQCEPDHCGLEALEDKQDHLEIEYEIIKEDMKDMEDQASQMKELCPARVDVLWTKVQTTLRAWNELGKSINETKWCLKEFVYLQDFFRSYLAMISWTEDTRSRIFSDAALNLSRDGQTPLAAELDAQIEQKFNEFDELATTGNNLLDKEHHLARMVRERMEELRSMLGWISVHWRAQKQQWLEKMSRQEASQDNIYSEAMCDPLPERSSPRQEALQPQQRQAVDSYKDTTKAARDSQPLISLPRQVEQNEGKQLDDGYEVMNSIGPSGDSPKANMVMLKENNSPPLGSTVNLILSFGNKGDSQAQSLDQPAVKDEVADEASEPVHRVSTYLHVKDNNLAAGPVYESITLPRQKTRSAASASPTFLSSSSVPPASMLAPQTSSVTFHPSTGSGNSSIFSSLKRMGKKRKRKRDARRHTIQKIMGVQEQTEGLPHYASGAITYDTHTWPLKEGPRKKSAAKRGAMGEAVAYMKNPLMKDIDTECSGEYSITPYAVSSHGPDISGQVRSHCRFLSLGSVLSFDLPKDMALIPSIQDIITIAPPESKNGAATHPDPHSQRHTVLSSFRQTRLAPSVTHTSAEISLSETAASAASIKDAHDVDNSLRLPPSPEEDEAHAVPCDELSKTGFGPHGKEEVERGKMKSEIGVSAQESDGQCHAPDVPIYVNHHPTPCRGGHNHKCPSVNTLIRDLNGHHYHKCAAPQNVYSSSPGPKLNQACHMRVNLKSTVSVSVRQDSVDSGISTSSSIKLCSDAPCADDVRPQGVVGRLVSLQVGSIDGSAMRDDAGPSSDASAQLAVTKPESVHPNHQQFEEEEEELEDIWNQTTKYRQSICSDIMYQPNQEEFSSSNQDQEPPCGPSLDPAEAVLYRNLVTASAPNLLVAEFKLPSHIQCLLGYDKGQIPKEHLPPLTKRDRRSWAAFTNRESTAKTSVTVNETASDPVKLPDVGEDQRYIYQYREDEEEEEENVGEEEEDEHTGGLKDESMSVLSVHLDLDRTSQESKASPDPQNTENPVEPMTTGGRCFILSGTPELHSMEGTLERKHKLQLGGKKAASRGWNFYHAVLYRNTLCFYQDRKDTLRSSACGLPLNLTGAECSPAPDYTKKSNCFRLRLRDGSEYLLNASSRFMMKKWMMKIQASTGQCEPSAGSVSADQDLTTSVCENRASGRRPRDLTSTFPRNKARHVAQAKEIIVLTRELAQLSQGHLKSVEEQSAASSSEASSRARDGDGGSLEEATARRLSGGFRGDTSPSPASCGQDWLSSKRRSHSFTSATYQKVKPVPHTLGGRAPEKGSNYCVTLVVGDKSTDSPWTSRSPEPPLLAAAGWQQEGGQGAAPRSYTSLPRPRNKSVFKKFFGRKDF